MKLTPILLASLSFIAFQEPTPGQVLLAAPAPEAPEAPLLSPEELDGLLAPIALYPDPLIAAILPAATVPLEIVLADRYLMNGGDPNEAQQQEWDTSVQALLQYPQLLQWMDDNLPWTVALGQAFQAQPEDVLDSIQRLRAKALALGNLPSTPQQTVLYDNGALEILPPTPLAVYVPDYPDVVYTTYCVPRIKFSRACPLGLWLRHDFDWPGRHLMTWHGDHPRPADWWCPRFGQRPTPASAHATVWQPRAHAAFTHSTVLAAIRSGSGTGTSQSSGGIHQFTGRSQGPAAASAHMSSSGAAGASRR